MPRRLAFVLVLAVAAGSLEAYTRNERRAGVPYFQADPGNVVYLVDPGARPGMLNQAGELVITPDSSPTAAIAAALERWSRIPGSALRFALPQPAADGLSRIDELNVITFADDPFNRAIIGGAIAVTRLNSNPDGALIDTDILLNPELPFSTTQAEGTFDIEGTVTHELGHAIGMDHAGPVTSTMFATAVRGSRRLRTLTEDDRAFVREVYPAEDAEPMGVLSGVVRTEAGSPVRGALVSAIDRARNVVLGTITEANGSYRFGSLPPGEYALTVDPLDGPASVLQFGFSRRGAIDKFRTTILGGPDNPTDLPVSAGQEIVQDLSIEDGPTLLNIVGLGVEEGEDGEVTTRAGAVLDRGGVYALQMHGNGLDTAEIGEGSLFFLGSGVSVVSDTLERDTLTFANGGSSFPRLRFEVFVAPDAPYGSLSIGLATPTDVTVLTAGIEIQATAPRPVFSADSVVNAASFAGGAVAPGSIISIFGENLGPATPAAGRFDTVTGGLRTELAETAVFIQQKPAPLFYAGPGQINAQVPDVAIPGLSALVRVVRQGVASESVLIPVVGEAPGVFTLDGAAAVALNEDGSLNQPGIAAARGSVITLYATGQGLTDPEIETGRPAPAEPLSRVEGAVGVFVAGTPAEVLFAGMAPGFVGLLQVNVRLPADIEPGPAQTLELRVRGVVAPPATLAIQ